jgi:hypothetical protein
MPAKIYGCATTADGKNKDSLITIGKGVFKISTKGLA